MIEIYQEINKHWESVCRDTKITIPERSGFSDFIQQIETDTRATTSISLQPWLAILEFGIEWLSYVHVALSENLKGSKKSARYRATWALVGAAVSFGLSVRLLCLTGLDTPARALLRTYVETLFLSLSILHDENLAAEYIKAEDDNDAKNFWHKLASPRNLHNRVIQIEKKFGLASDDIDVMTAWRRQEYEILSQSSHLSFVAAFLTARSPSLDDTDKLVIGIFGSPTENSIRTISYAASTTWYFSRFSYNSLIGHEKSDSLLTLDRSDEWQQQLVIGREVLSRITLDYWEQFR